MKRDTRALFNDLDIHVSITSRAWARDLRMAAACAKRAARAAVKHVNNDTRQLLANHGTVEIGILLATDHAVRRLNRDYRGVDKPTNVLSFSTFSPEDARISGAPILLGDIALAYGIMSREARAAGKSLAAHLSHLVVHGVLHLLGYDHQLERDALKMEALETEILAGLGVTNPYIETPNKMPAEQKAQGQPGTTITRARAKK